MWIARAFLAAVAVACAASPAFAYSNKVVREWFGSCDDRFNCSMQSQPAGDDIYTIEFARDAGANAPVTFSLSHRGVLVPDSMIVLSVPDQLERFELPLSGGVFNNGTWRFSDPDIGRILIPAVRAGSSIIVAIETDKGGFEETASLSGSSAVMLWLDEVQHRLGKTDALVAKGPDAATGRASRSRLIDSSADVPQSVLTLWRSPPDECDAHLDGKDMLAGLPGFAVSVEEDVVITVYILPCGGPGAYNLSYAGFLHDGGTDRAKRLMFPTMFDKGPGIFETIFNAGWDDDSARLQAFYKGRGLGDCGTASSWEWSGDGFWGNFILVEEQNKDDCDGDYDTPWPRTWPLE